MKKKKAIALISGGLDSILAVKVIEEQNIECIGIYFTSPFWSSSEKEENLIKKCAEENKITIIIVPLDKAYIKMIKKPKHGLGKNMNPCIDCKIFMLSASKKLMRKYKADFIVTGEVLGQRPMSQHKNALNLIAKEAGVKNILIRPLSAKLLNPTEPENANLLLREKFLDINGRGRKVQYELAAKYNIKTFSSPAGGCLLTDEIFCKRLNDLFTENKNPSMKDITLLKYGRHFRYGRNKIVVGRNEAENKKIIELKNISDTIFEVPGIGSPNTLLQGIYNKKAFQFAAELTLYYSDSGDEEKNVSFGKSKLNKSISVNKISKTIVEKYNLSNTPRNRKI